VHRCGANPPQNLSFPKITSGRIRAMRRNRGIIRHDVCYPPFAWDVCRQSVQVAPPPNLSGPLQRYTYAAREILANCTSPACRKNRELEHSIMSISRNVMISLPRQTFVRHLSVLVLLSQKVAGDCHWESVIEGDSQFSI